MIGIHLQLVILTVMLAVYAPMFLNRLDKIAKALEHLAGSETEKGN